MKVTVKLVPVVVGTLSLGGTVGGSIALSNTSKEQVVALRDLRATAWERVSVGEEETIQSPNKLEKRCWRQFLEVFSLGNGASEEQVDLSIQYGCGEWAKNIGNVNKPTEIFRGYKDEVYSLLEGSSFLTKNENLESKVGQEETEWNIKNGKCVKKDLQDGKIEITCERNSASSSS